VSVPAGGSVLHVEGAQPDIAQELHVGPVQDLAVARLHLDLARRQAADGTELASRLDALDQALASGADALRGIVARLRAV
jgi:signal transduction histidine kinase